MSLAGHVKECNIIAGLSVGAPGKQSVVGGGLLKSFQSLY